MAAILVALGFGVTRGLDDAPWQITVPSWRRDVEGEADLLHVVLAGAPPGGFPGRLHGRQQQTDERADDGDDDEQLNEREASGMPGNCMNVIRPQRYSWHGSNLCRRLDTAPIPTAAT
jgi:hypothetical protein